MANLNLSQVLQALRVGEETHRGRFGWRPLFGGEEGPCPWVSLDQALEKGWIEITEVSEDGSVNDLLVTHRGDRPVLILEGEVLEGAKQNRVLNLSILVPPGARLEVPVACVEAGRWHWRARRFEGAGSVLYREARASLNRSVSEHYREGAPRTDQRAVWDEVNAKLRGMGVASASADLLAAQRRHREALDEIAAALEAEPGQVGVVFHLDGVPVGIEVFGHEAMLAACLPKLGRGYALDALDPQAVPPAGAAGDVQGLLAALARVAPERRPAVGLGEQWRIDAGAFVGAALMEGGRLVHLGAFPARTPDDLSREVRRI